MRKVILFFVCMFFATVIFAEPLIERTSTNISLTTVKVDEGDYIYTITLTPEYQKILEWQLISPLKWIDDAVVNKLNNSSGRMILELSDKRPETISRQEKETLIKNSKLETRIEKELND